MAARRWPVLLLALLNLAIFAHPCDTQELRCQCTRITSQSILCRFVKTLQVIYKNIYCDRMEVIAELKNGDVICLNQNVSCVSALVDRITSRLQLKDHIPRESLQGMKLLYNVEFEKPLYLSYVMPRD